MEKFKHILFSFAAVLLTLPTTAFAQFENPLRSDISSVAGFMEALLRTATYILFPLAVVFIVYSGFLFASSQGNSKDLETAKTNFIWVVIGVALLLGAWALAALIKGTIEPILG